MKTIKLNKVKCLRCGYEWTPRNSIIRVCAKCRSPYWDIEKKQKKNKDDSINKI